MRDTKYEKNKDILQLGEDILLPLVQLCRYPNLSPQTQTDIIKKMIDSQLENQYVNLAKFSIGQMGFKDFLKQPNSLKNLFCSISKWCTIPKTTINHLNLKEIDPNSPTDRNIFIDYNKHRIYLTRKRIEDNDSTIDDKITAIEVILLNYWSKFKEISLKDLK